MTELPDTGEAWGPPEYESDWPAAARKAPFAFRLLGRFTARCEAGDLPQLHSRRLQQLIAYLHLFRDRPQRRDAVAATLWPESTPAQSLKNLRQSLWLLQRSDGSEDYLPQLILADREWLRLNPEAVWVDVAELEATFLRVRDVPPETLTEHEAADLAATIDLYKGDLLEGWTERWCVQERNRLSAVYRALLDKLVGYCEESRRVETGLAYCDLLVRHDRASERAHWRMMRLQRLAGDRTAALRQFEKCRLALQTELGVEPGRLIRDLYEEICSSS